MESQESDLVPLHIGQPYKVFFGKHDPLKAKPPTEAEKRWAVDSKNPKCPFSKFIGNEKAIRKLSVIVYDALGKPNHLCRDLAIALLGPPSTGKTTLAKLFAKAVDLPFAEISPKSIKDIDDLVEKIADALGKAGCPLTELDPDFYIFPPCIIFLDEVHALKDAIIQGLLKATEHKDSVLVTESGLTINCFNVCWIIATTDSGSLFDAFKTRFSSIDLKYLTKKEVAKIVKLANPDWNEQICDLVAYYNSRIPRKALEFARYMRLERQMENKPWEEIAKVVAENEGIDKYGMHESHLNVLKALKDSPVSQKNMCNIVGRKLEELERFIMPWLLVETDDQAAYVKVTNKGYAITEAGKEELTKRGIDVA